MKRPDIDTIQKRLDRYSLEHCDYCDDEYICGGCEEKYHLLAYIRELEWILEGLRK